MLDILKIFEENSTRFSEKIAIIGKKTNYTYGRFKKVTDELSSFIIDHKGKNNGVSVIMSHGENMIICLFSLLKSNNVYVPFNPNKNFQEIKECMHEIESTIIFTDDVNYDKCTRVFFEDEYFIINIDDYLRNKKMYKIATKYTSISKKYDSKIAYILHTSGSTGKPKAVLATSDNVNYLTKNVNKMTPISHDSTILFSTPYYFDVSLTEMLCWAYGGCAVCYDLSSDFVFEELKSLFLKERVTHFCASPSFFTVFLSYYSDEEIVEICNSLKYVVLGGERFNKSIYYKWKQLNLNFCLINGYGPTETSVYCTYFTLSKEMDYEDIPIGYPLDDVNYLIEQSNSELLIGGKGVTEGYVNPVITKEKYIKIDGETYYKTGDIVNKRGDLLYFVGRNDNQIQINGVRVELGEIENRLEEIRGVIQAKVVFYKDKVIAFLKTNTLAKDSYQEYINQTFETFLRPNMLVCMKNFPLTPNNKVDIKKLISLLDEEENNIGSIPLKNDIEKDLSKIIIDILNIDENMLGRDSSFFELGGDSLSAALLTFEIEKSFNISISINTVYSCSTIEKLAMCINEQMRSDMTTITKSSERNSSINEIKNIIEDYVTTERKVKKFEKTMHLQRVYYFDDFRSQIKFEYEFLDKNIDEVEDIMKIIIKSSPLLTSYLVEQNNELQFAVTDYIPIPRIVLDNPTKEDVLAIFKLMYDSIHKNRKYNGLLSIFLLLKTKSSIKILGCMDHTIADGSTESTLSSMIESVKEGRVIEKGKSYTDYVNLIALNNTVESIRESLFYKELTSDTLQSNLSLMTLHIGVQKYSIPFNVIPRKITAENINIVLSYFVGKYFIEMQNADGFVVKCIANGKDYLGKEYRNTIGDFHTSLYIPVYKNDDFSSFYRSTKNMIRRNYVDKQFRPSFVYGNTYPKKNQIQKEIKESLKSITHTSIDFLGACRSTELTEIKQSIILSLTELMSLEDSIYITSFLTDNSIVIFSNKNLTHFQEFIDKISVSELASVLE